MTRSMPCVRERGLHVLLPPGVNGDGRGRPGVLQVVRDALCAIDAEVGHHQLFQPLSTRIGLEDQLAVCLAHRACAQ